MSESAQRDEAWSSTESLANRGELLHAAMLGRRYESTHHDCTLVRAMVARLRALQRELDAVTARAESYRKAIDRPATPYVTRSGIIGVMKGCRVIPPVQCEVVRPLRWFEWRPRLLRNWRDANRCLCYTGHSGPHRDALGQAWEETS